VERRRLISQSHISEAIVKRLVRAVIAAMLFLGWCNAVPGADRTARAPLFDAHLHYNGEARGQFPVAQALAQLQEAGVRAVIATSTPNDGTRGLAKAVAGGPIAVIPFLRPYRTDSDRATWFNDPAIAAFVDDELARDGSYRGIGEFHVHGGADASGIVMKHIVDVAVARGFWLHAHCDDAALEAIFGHDARVKVIWAHSGFTTPPAKIAAYLAQHPTLMAELSYRSDIASAAKVSPAWSQLLAQYPDRFLLGSDTWTNERWSSYSRIIDDYRAWLDDLPRETAEHLLWGNGARMFGLPR
jgi:Amidohydrolase